MKRTANSSFLPRNEAKKGRASPQLVLVPLDNLRPHPANANVMEEGYLQKLAENIKREGNYPPLVVRPHAQEPGAYQILDGHQRWEVLRRLGHREAQCYIWPCDDRTALLLLATLNRLQGRDDPRKRAELLHELTLLASPEDLGRLLPEDATAIARSLEFLDLNLDDLLAELQQDTASSHGLRAINFAVQREDEELIEEAVRAVASSLEGTNRRGRALAAICKTYLEGRR